MWGAYMGASLIRTRTLPGPYRRPVPRVLGGVLGRWAFSYWRGILTLPVAGMGVGGGQRHFDAREPSWNASENHGGVGAPLGI